MKGGIEGTVSATLWTVDDLLANLAFAAASESSAAEWSNLQVILGQLFWGICKNMRVYKLFYKTAVIAVRVAEKKVKAKGMVL